jgi:hypothetical protein
MEATPRLNGILEIYNASGEFTTVAGEKTKVDIAGVKEFEMECPAGKKHSKIRISIEIIEETA